MISKLLATPLRVNLHVVHFLLQLKFRELWRIMPSLHIHEWFRIVSIVQFVDPNRWNPPLPVHRALVSTWHRSDWPIKLNWLGYRFDPNCRHKSTIWLTISFIISNAGLIICDILFYSSRLKLARLASKTGFLATTKKVSKTVYSNQYWM